MIDRTTNPDAMVTLLMRFETPFGPRTIVANGLPVKDASLVADVINSGGNYAEFIQERARFPLAKESKKSNVIPIKRRKP